MWSCFLVPLHPDVDPLSGLLEAAKLVLPDALFLEAAKESFNEPILLRGVWGNKFLGQAVVVTGSSKAATLENQAVVTAKEQGGSNRAKRVRQAASMARSAS